MLAPVALLLAAAMVFHLAMLFLTVAPQNAFSQDWKLFAPHPMQRNDAVGMRLETVDRDGEHHLSTG